MLKRFPIYLAIILAIVVGTFSYIPTEAQDTPPATSSLLVKLISGLSPAEQGAVITRNGGNEVNSIVALRLHVIEVPGSTLAVRSGWEGSTPVSRTATVAVLVG